MRAFIFVAWLVAVPGMAKADWLELMPDCAFGPEARSLGHTALLYPRAGLPAVVEPGQDLVVRIRVPSALTPPPGIQQDRALSGWRAVLTGNSATLREPSEHRYPLRVVDVRPDGGSSLVYRATVRIPYWTAPGVYGFFVDAPGGDDTVAAAVRVVASGSEVKLRLLGSLQGDDGAGADDIERVRAQLRRLSYADVDVWVARETGALRAALDLLRVTDTQPWPVVLLLPESGLPVVLRTGATAWILGRCESRLVPFEQQVAGVLRRRDLSRGAWPDLPAADEACDTDGRTFALPAADSVSIERRADEVRIGVAESHTLTAVVHLTFPVGAEPVVVDGAELSFHPATPVGSAAERRSVLARLRITPGTMATIGGGPRAPLAVELHPEPESLTSHQQLEVRARSAEDLALVAWRLDDDVTAVGPVVRHTYGILGTQRLHALAIAEDGRAAPLQLDIEVQTHEVTGCDSAGCDATGRLAFGFELWMLALLLVQRRRRRNKPASANRWTS